MENDYKADEKWVNYAKNNDEKTFALLFERDFPERAAKRYEENDAFKMFNDVDFMKDVMNMMKADVYRKLRKYENVPSNETENLNTVHPIQLKMLLINEI